MKTALIVVLALPMLWLGIFQGLKLTGDSLLKADRIQQAAAVYEVARKIKPGDSQIRQRLLAINVISEERRTHSEETDGALEDVAAGQNYFSNILGSKYVPVLMYHYIRVNPLASDKLGFSLSVPPDHFQAQMDYLASKGYHSVSLDELGAALLSNAPLPPKSLVLTFDDGYADFHDAAFPILRAHNFKGVNFVITGLVGAPGYLSWPQIDEMKNSGFVTFGAHTVTHRALGTLSNESVKTEVTDSKNVLAGHLGSPVNWLAYPYGGGAFSPRVVNIVRQTGYIGAFGTQYGRYQSTDVMFSLPRVRIDGGISLAAFASLFP